MLATMYLNGTTEAVVTLNVITAVRQTHFLTSSP